MAFNIIFFFGNSEIFIESYFQECKLIWQKHGSYNCFTFQKKIFFDFSYASLYVHYLQ